MKSPSVFGAWFFCFEIRIESYILPSMSSELNLWRICYYSYCDTNCIIQCITDTCIAVKANARNLAQVLGPRIVLWKLTQKFWNETCTNRKSLQSWAFWYAFSDYACILWFLHCRYNTFESSFLQLHATSMAKWAYISLGNSSKL